MSSDTLVSVDDADLDNVVGGIGASLDLDFLGSASIKLDQKGLLATLALFGKTLKAGLDFVFSIE